VKKSKTISCPTESTDLIFQTLKYNTISREIVPLRNRHTIGKGEIYPFILSNCWGMGWGRDTRKVYHSHTYFFASNMTELIISTEVPSVFLYLGLPVFFCTFSSHVTKPSYAATYLVTNRLCRRMRCTPLKCT
jgi:hypothetical protein